MSGPGALCWRHHVRLFVAAYGCLLDITGRTYPRWSRQILNDSRRCDRCAGVRAR